MTWQLKHRLVGSSITVLAGLAGLVLTLRAPYTQHDTVTGVMICAIVLFVGALMLWSACQAYKRYRRDRYYTLVRAVYYDGFRSHEDESYLQAARDELAAAADKRTFLYRETVTDIQQRADGDDVHTVLVAIGIDPSGRETVDRKTYLVEKGHRLFVGAEVRTTAWHDQAGSIYIDVK